MATCTLLELPIVCIVIFVWMIGDSGQLLGRKWDACPNWVRVERPLFNRVLGKPRYEPGAIAHMDDLGVFTYNFTDHTHSLYVLLSAF